jgi:uncharacterized protein
MKTLHLAKDLDLPLDAVTQTLAAIGRKGAGKTYLAGVIAEQMLDAEAQVVVLDPVGNWFGLRIGADGKAPGKEIFVIGGEHGDVPLTSEAGARIAQLLVEKRASAVLDISEFRIGERKRFAAAFGEELFHLKKAQRSPVHLFIEEAQLFAPQRPGPDEARMLGAFEAIVRLGRNYGIGATLITQRPQSVNKEVLSQVECLCVLQVNGSHERKALEEWVQEAGADRKLVGELPGLERGEGYVWSPSWLRTFRRVRFANKTTFDASATPEVGKETKAAKLTAVDVVALRSDMAEVVAKAENDDPKALRRRIAELERAARNIPQNIPAEKPPRIKEVPALKEGQAKRIETAASKAAQAAEAFRSAVAELMPILARVAAGKVNIPEPRILAPRPIAARAIPVSAAQRTSEPRPVASDSAAQNGLDKAQRSVLAVLAQYPDGCAAGKLTLLAGYRWSGGFRNALAALRTAGLIVGTNTGVMQITDTGLVALGDAYDPLPTGHGLIDYWLRHPSLGACERAVLRALLERPEGLGAEDLAKAAGYGWSGGFRNALANLRTAGLIIGRNTEVMRASPDLEAA